MADVASSPPPPTLTPDQQLQADQLDDEISTIRAEIAALTQRNSLLSSTLLASTNIQSRLRQHYSSDESLTPLLDSQYLQRQASAYRLAFGITSFPFVDPSPDTSNTRLLGLRFDICKHSGEFDSPYYILLQRNESNSGDGAEVGNEWKVHRHTIPALVPLQKYEERYLPITDEGYGSEDSVLDAGQNHQNLIGFATSVRNALTSWQMRKDAVELCLEKLALSDPKDTLPDEEGGGGAPALKYDVQSIDSVAVDAYFIRIVWRNGRVGRIKVGDDGLIQKIAVFGNVDGEEKRCQNVEKMLLAGSGRVDELAERLEEVHSLASDSPL